MLSAQGQQLTLFPEKHSHLRRCLKRRAFGLRRLMGIGRMQESSQLFFQKFLSAVKEVGGSFSCSGRSPFKGEGSTLKDRSWRLKVGMSLCKSQSSPFKGELSTLKR